LAVIPPFLPEVLQVQTVIEQVLGFITQAADYAYYGKVVKVFSNGNIGLGAYIAHSQGYRPTFIPESPIYPGNGNQGVTVNGYYPDGNSVPGPYFSQQTTGYYSSLAFDVWNKLARNHMYLIYSPINLKVSKSVSFHNLVWYREGGKAPLPPKRFFARRRKFV
jgi:hypothetical protein